MNLHDAFHTEIQFWNEMLKDQGRQTSPEVIERIQMAKTLAEQKLSLYTAECLERVN